MKVIILCGGAGTRLKEETEFKPKPMVMIGDKPLLWHIMKIYSHFGFNEFVLALGYKADYIKDYFLNQKAFTTDFSMDTKSHKTKFHLQKKGDQDKFKITFVGTGVETLPGERILICQKYIPINDRYFMVTYGDGVSNIDIKKLLAFHKKQKTIGTISAVHPRSKYGLIKITADNLVKGFTEKPVLSDWVNGGFMVFNRSFFKYLKPGEFEHAAMTRIADKNQLSVYKHEDFWFAIDTYKELDELNKICNSGNVPWKVW